MGFRPKVNLGPVKELIHYINSQYKQANYTNTELDRMISQSTLGRRKEPKPWSATLQNGSDFSFTWDSLNKILDNMGGMLLYINHEEDDEILVESVADVPSIIKFLKTQAKNNPKMHSRLSSYIKKKRTPYVAIFIETLANMGYKFEGIITRDHEYESAAKEK